jgi:hypothetical protein
MSKSSLLSLGQASMAEKANDRISKLRVRTFDSKYRSEIAALESEFEKKFKIGALTKKVRAAKKKLREAEHALEDAQDAAKKAARAKVAKIESRRTDALESESTRTHVASLTILGATLPDDIRKALQIEETKNLLTVGA